MAPRSHAARLCRPCAHHGLRTNAYFGDTIPGKPWTSKTKHAVDLFWKARDKWLPTWQGEHADLRIDWVRVWQD